MFYSDVMHKVMNNKIILLFVILLFGIKAQSYPILEVPMSELIESSDLIIMGNVIDIKSIKDSQAKAAYILVKSNLKGSNASDTIIVEFYTEVTCPQQGKYKKGTNILTFLSYKDSIFHVNGFSHGVRIIDKEMPDFEKMILEYISLAEVQNSSIRRNKLINWIIETIENPNIRAEGIIMLTSKYLIRNQAIAKSDLTKGQIARITEVLVGLEQFGFTDLKMIEFVLEDDCNRVLAWSNKKIEEIFNQKNREIDTFKARRIMLAIKYSLSEESIILGQLIDTYIKEDLKRFKNKKKMKCISLKFIMEVKKICA